MTLKSLVPITLPTDPVGPTEAATKKYVDDTAYSDDWKQACRVVSTTDVGSTYTPNTGAGTASPGTLAGTPLVVDGVTLTAGNRVLLVAQTDQRSNGIWYVVTPGSGFSGTWARPPDFGGGSSGGYVPPALSSGLAVGVTEGTQYHDTLWSLTNDSTTLIQVDGASGANLKWGQFPTVPVVVHTTVKLATSATIVFSMGSGGNLTIDGIPVANGDRVLIKDSTATAYNGIYVANTGGSWSRATDADTWAELPGALVVVTDGQVNAGTTWLCTSVADGIKDVTANFWSKLAGPGNTELIGALYLGSGTATYAGPTTVPGAALTAYTDGTFRLWSITGGVATLVFSGGTGSLTAWAPFQTLTGLDNFAGFGGAVTARIRPDGTITSQNLPGYNYLDNGNLTVWQRGTPVTPGAVNVAVVGPDRWMIRSAGAALTSLAQTSMVSQRPGAVSNLFALAITGAASVTTCSIFQRMEVEPLSRLFNSNGQSVTVSFSVYNGTGAAFTPSIVLSTPDSGVENFAAVTNVVTLTTQNCPTGQVTTVQATVTAANLAGYPNIANGLQVELLIPTGNLTAGKVLTFMGGKIEIGSVATPAIPETIALETIRCQRHFYRIQSQGTQHFLCQFAQTTSAAGYGILTFPIRMRVAPAASVSAQNHASTFVGGTTTVGSVFVGACTPETSRVQVSAAGTQGWAGYMMLNTSTAWIQFSAEL